MNNIASDLVRVWGIRKPSKTMFVRLVKKPYLHFYQPDV